MKTKLTPEQKAYIQSLDSKKKRKKQKQIFKEENLSNKRLSLLNINDKRTIKTINFDGNPNKLQDIIDIWDKLTKEKLEELTKPDLVNDFKNTNGDIPDKELSLPKMLQDKKTELENNINKLISEFERQTNTVVLTFAPNEKPLKLGLAIDLDNIKLEFDMSKSEVKYTKEDMKRAFFTKPICFTDASFEEYLKTLS